MSIYKRWAQSIKNEIQHCRDGIDSRTLIKLPTYIRFWRHEPKIANPFPQPTKFIGATAKIT